MPPYVVLTVSSTTVLLSWKSRIVFAVKSCVVGSRDDPRIAGGLHKGDDAVSDFDFVLAHGRGEVASCGVHVPSTCTGNLIVAYHGLELDELSRAVEDHK